MYEYHFETETLIPAPRDAVFSFFSEAENLARITPPSLHFRILSPLPIEMRAGAIIDYVIRLHGFPMKWRTLISQWNPPFDFVDEQLKGPYKKWIHHHQFTETADGQTRMKDSVRYAIPFAPFGLLAHPFVRREITTIFDFRGQTIKEIFPSRS